MNEKPKPLVKNAADEAQVKDAGKKLERQREQELGDLRSVLSSREGRRFMWRLLGHCKVYGSVWETSARIHYNAGQQDVGHFILSEISEADQELIFKMMKEAKEETSKDV